MRSTFALFVFLTLASLTTSVVAQEIADSPADTLADPDVPVEVHPPPQADAGTFHFDSERRLRLHVAEPGSEVARELCRAPCDVSLPTGEHRLALSRISDSDLQWVSPLRLSGTGTLHGRYVDNGGLRTAGWLVFILGLVTAGAGAAVGLAMVDGGGITELNGGFGLLLGGAVHLLVALAAGLPMMAAGDGAVMRFE